MRYSAPRKWRMKSSERRNSERLPRWEFQRRGIQKMRLAVAEAAMDVEQGGVLGPFGEGAAERPNSLAGPRRSFEGLLRMHARPQTLGLPVLSSAMPAPWMTGRVLDRPLPQATADPTVWRRARRSRPSPPSARRARSMRAMLGDPVADERLGRAVEARLCRSRPASAARSRRRTPHRPVRGAASRACPCRRPVGPHRPVFVRAITQTPLFFGELPAPRFHPAFVRFVLAVFRPPPSSHASLPLDYVCFHGRPAAFHPFL